MESALDRFAETRGSALIGGIGMGRQWRLQFAIGSVFAALGVGLGIAGWSIHEPGLLGGACGPALAGLVNMSVGLGFRRQARRQAPAVALSPEATALLRALVLRAGVWQGGSRRMGQGRRAYEFGAGGPLAWSGYQAPAQPSASAMDSLERAAAAYDRIAGALEDSGDERARRLRSAADAGMGEALHLAATDRLENAEIERMVSRLDELAGLVERSVELPEPVNPPPDRTWRRRWTNSGPRTPPVRSFGSSGA